jgi:hypothetical protein
VHPHPPPELCNLHRVRGAGRSAVDPVLLVELDPPSAPARIPSGWRTSSRSIACSACACSTEPPATAPPGGPVASSLGRAAVAGVQGRRSEVRELRWAHDRARVPDRAGRGEEDPGHLGLPATGPPKAGSAGRFAARIHRGPSEGSRHSDRSELDPELSDESRPFRRTFASWWPNTCSTRGQQGMPLTVSFVLDTACFAPTHGVFRPREGGVVTCGEWTEGE